MAVKRKSSFSNIRNKIEKAAPPKKKVKDSNIEDSSFMTDAFPLVIFCFVILIIVGCYFLFKNYKEVLKIDSDGFLLSSDTLILGTKRTENDLDLVNIVSVNENDIIYKNPVKHYVDNEKSDKVNIQYPLFIDNGLSFINYNDDTNLIDHEFNRTTGYSGLIFSYGRAFDSVGYVRIDQEHYLLLSYDDNVMINLYDLKVKTSGYEYNIPVNSFVYFEENSISYYERTENGFVYNSIKDVDFNSELTFFYISAKEEYIYNYEKFLKGIDTVYIKEEVIPDEPITPEKPKEEVIPPTDVNPSPVIPEQFVWEKPEVNVSNIKTNVYSMTGDISIVDKAKVIVKEPTFTLYRNGKTFLRRTFYSSGTMDIVGLIPSTTFTMVGTYTYLASDMETRIVVTFYSKEITSKSLDTLNPITLSFTNGEIYPKKIEVKDLHITSELNDEAIKGVNRVSLEVDGKSFYLSNTQILDLINGRKTTVFSPENLPSSSPIDYSFKFLDREGNELKLINYTGRTRTSKRAPNVSIRIKSSEIDSITFSINERNEDNIVFTNYIYVVTKSDGSIVKKDYVTSNEIVLTDLDPDQMFNIKLYSDYDIDDGKGLVVNRELATLDFTTKPLTTLGYVNLPMDIVSIDSSSVSIEYYINFRKTNNVLVRLVKKFIFNVYDSETDELVSSSTIEEADVLSLRDGNKKILTLSNLKSNHKYKVEVTTIIQQGSTVYELGTTQGLEEFETYKIPARVYLTNCFTTETMFDFDISVDDPDRTIETNYVRLEIRDKDNTIIDSRKINVNAPTERITYNNLDTNEFYTIYVYADGYNETNINSNYKSKYLLKEYSVYTESGISGKIELVSSLRVPTGQNIADMRSEVKWLQMYNTYNVPKTIDKDGNMHIYSKNGDAAYTFNLAEYHGEIVTVSFKIKAVTPVVDAYNIYFTQYISGSSNSRYSKVLTDLSNETYRSYSFTYRVGSYHSLGSMDKTMYPMSYNSFGHNYGDSAGFYISGGTGVMSEYVIKDFEVHVQYDKELYDYGDAVIEQGGWSDSVDVESSKLENDSRVRLSKPILLTGNKRYSFEFDNDSDYEVYIYLHNKTTGKKVSSVGWYNSEISIYVPEDQYARLIFRYREGAGTINPDNIKNFRIYQYTDNLSHGYTDFEYDLVTKVKVNLFDKRDEITNNDYFIKIYEGTQEVKSYNYVELDQMSSIENIIKELDLEENKNFNIELGIKIRDRYYSLSTFEMSTDDEVLGISTLSEWSLIQPHGNYILLNDLNFQNYTDQRIGEGYRYFYGTIDFQGYTLHQYTAKSDGTSNTDYYRFRRIETSAVLKNLVLDINLNNKNLNDYVYGLVRYNYGTIENVSLTITDTKETELPQKIYGLLTQENRLKGRIKNFSIKINGDLHYYADSGLLVGNNYGHIENGYIYGDDVIVDFGLLSGSNRELGIITNYVGPKGVIDNVYSTVSYQFPDNAAHDVGGIFAYQSYGTIKNSYLVGDANPAQPSIGPYIHSVGSTAKFDNVYYVSNNIYTSDYLVKASASSLYDSNFQFNVLGDGFNIDEMISLGYYPQLKYSSNKMPNQDYIELPTINTDDYADIIYMDVVESKSDYAKVNVSVNNPLGETISEIVISDLTTTILDQSYADGKSEVIIEVSNPQIFASKYSVNSISSKSANGYVSTRKYQSNELYLVVDMYKEIFTPEDFIAINESLGQNYRLMEDLDLSSYSDFYINNFSGKFDGNNHKISNINITRAGKSGLFNQMNGTLQNVTFENVYKSSTSTYHGVVGSSNKYGKFNNVHVINFTLNIGDTVVTDGMRVGSLVGSAAQSNISYCSSSDVTISSTGEVANLSVGGLVGYSEGLFINNSFVENVKINVENAISTKGVGGLIGIEASSEVGSVDSCYTTGSINTNSANAGGLVGQALGYITNSYSSVNLVSAMSYIGGLVGNGRQSTTTAETSLYLGNLYSASVDQYIHRIVANYKSSSTNYSMDSNLINGSTSDVSNGENVLTYNDYLKTETYENIFDNNSYDYSQVTQGILPKLYAQDGETLMPNQRDNYLYKNMFKIIKMSMDKHANDVMVTLYLENPDNYEITGVTVEDATLEINRNASSDGITVLEFNLTPLKYFDSYRISELTYIDENGVEQTLERNIRLDAVFYKTLATYDDWQKISTTDAENYLLINDIDFTGKTNVKTNVMFNRLETSGDGIYFTIKGIDLNYTTNGNYHVLIQKISTTLRNVNFENINIKDSSSSTSNNYVGLIMYNYGSLKNLSFKNIVINAPKKNYVAPIGNNFGYIIDNITIDNVDTTGRTYVAGFVAYDTNTVNDQFNNINAVNVDVYSSRSYAGGLFGRYSSAISYKDAPIYKNMTIKDSTVKGTAYYVGGIVGYGDCNYCTVDNVEVTGKYYVGGAVGRNRGNYQYGNVVKNSNISGTDYYIGGVYGYSVYIYDMFLMDSTVEGLGDSTHSVGGISGYRGGSGVITRCGVLDSTIKNNGERTGGIIGYSVDDVEIYDGYVTDSTVSGYNKTGGLIGEAYGYGINRYNRISNTNVASTNNYAGGLIGYYNNDNSYGSYKEAYVEEATLENVNVNSTYYAGGFFGGTNATLYYASRVRKLYFSGSVETSSGATAGLASGDARNQEILDQPRVYAYENSLLSGVPIKDTAGSSTVLDVNLLDTVSFYPGYIDNGTPSYNENDANSSYSDFIKLSKDKSYELNIDYIANPSSVTIFLYTPDKVFVEEITDKKVDTYIGSYHATSNYDHITFTSYRECFIRINITYNDRVNSLTLNEVKKPNSINKDRLLNSGQLRERLTWLNKISSTTHSSASRLLLSSDYWDDTPIRESYPTVSIKDLSGNNYLASGMVGSISSEGVIFEGTSTYPMYLEVPDYQLPIENDAITVSTKVSAFSSRTNGTLFSVMNGSKGFNLMISSLQIYVRINSTNIATGYYIPYLTPVDITAVYNNKTIKVYVNGNEIYSDTCGKLVVDSTYETYIAHSEYYFGKSSNYNFVGKMYDLKVFNKALTESEIRDNIAASSGISNTNGLSLRYDFTTTGIDYTSYYPLLKSGSAIYDIKNQRKVEMPSSTYEYVSVPVLSTYSFGSSMLNDYVNVYSSGIDTINLEFKEYSQDMSFNYRINDKEYESKVTKNVYTLHYDYMSDIEIELSNSFEKKVLTFTSNDLTKKIKYYNGKYYHIDVDGALYENGTLLTNNALHIYNNLVLLSNGRVYNLNTYKPQILVPSKGILSNSIPLSSAVLNNSIIDTYYNFTYVDNAKVDGQMYVKDNHVYMFNTSDTLNDNIVYNLYNNDEYQIVLNKDGSISSYKAGIKYPSSFVNSDIREISFDKNSNDTVIMIRYNNSNVIAFDYITGKELFRDGEEMIVSLFDYLEFSLSSEPSELTSPSREYTLSKSFLESLESASKNNVSEIINSLDSSNNSTSNKLDSKYLSVYNSNTNSFDIYNINDIVSGKDEFIEDSMKESEKVDVENGNIKTNIELVPLSDKVKSNFVLYNYFYNSRSNKTVENNKTIIYYIIIGFVIINLFVLSYLYSKKEKANE